MKNKLVDVIVLVCIVLTLVGCAPERSAAVAAAAPSAAPAADVQGKYAGKKVLYISSYHEGYPWADGIVAGLRSVFDGTGVDMKIVYLDTKRNPDVAYGQAAGLKAKGEVDAFKPDVIIASDDNAQKYVVVPYLKGGAIPVIFNGINWDASAYGYSPANNITGMVEVELPDQMVSLLRAYAKGDRLGYLTIDSETERKVVDIYNQRFFKGQMQTYWVKTQDEFKAAFITAQTEQDMLFMGNNAGSDKWDEAEMKKFVLDNTTIPTGSINDWMAPYSLLTLAKSSNEQGEWSAQTALRILDGTPVKDIPFVENKKGGLMANLLIADKLSVVFAPSLLKNAVIIDAQPGQ